MKHRARLSSAQGVATRCANLTRVSLGRRLRAAVTGPQGPRVVLHIGAMKTGTTYLQHLLDDNREQLASVGVLWPGDAWEQQMLAAMDVMATSAGRRPTTPAALGMWDEITDQMREHEGPASVFSMEWLSYADERQAQRVVDSFPGHDVHVVVTVRDARYAVPAQWQTSCRMAGVVPLRRLVKAMERPTSAPNPGRAAKLLQRTQDIPRMLEVWTALVGPERTHVVTVPPKGSDPTMLWRRFADVLDVDPELCAPPTSYIHTSLGHESTEFLRLVNVALGREVRRRGVRPVKRVLVRHLLTRAESETPIRLNRRGIRLSGRWNRNVREAITASGARVVGDLEDLWQGPPPSDAPRELFEPAVADLLLIADTALDCLEEHRAALLAGEGRDDDHHGPDDDEPDDDEHDDESDDDADDESRDDPGETATGGRRAETATSAGAVGPGPADEEVRQAVQAVADLILECVAIMDDPLASTH